MYIILSGLVINSIDMKNKKYVLLVEFSVRVRDKKWRVRYEEEGMRSRDGSNLNTPSLSHPIPIKCTVVGAEHSRNFIINVLSFLVWVSVY